MLHYITLLLCLSFGEVFCGAKGAQNSEKPATATKPASEVIKLQRVDGRPTAMERESVFYNSDAHTHKAIKAILIRYPDKIEIIKTDKNFLILKMIDKTEKFDTSKVRASGVFMKLGEDQILVEIKKGDGVKDDAMPGRLISENKSYQLRLLNQKELEALIRKLPAGMQYIGINEIKPLEKNGYFVHCTNLSKTKEYLRTDWSVWNKTNYILNAFYSTQTKEVTLRNIYLNKNDADKANKKAIQNLCLDENGLCKLEIQSKDKTYEVMVTESEFNKCVEFLISPGDKPETKTIAIAKYTEYSLQANKVVNKTEFGPIPYIWLEIVPESSSATPQKK